MKKLSLLFALLCASMLGWAFDENAKFPATGTYANQFYWKSIDGVTAPMGVNSVEIKEDVDVIFINVGEAGFDKSTGVVGCEAFTEEGAGVWVKIPSLTKRNNEIYFKTTAGETLRGLIIVNTAISDESCTDNDAPTVSAVSVGSITSNSATITITATDNAGGSGISRYVVKNGETQIASNSSNVITLTGLASNTTYDNIKVFAYDACDNVSNAYGVESFKTEELIYYQFPTGHLGQADFGDPNGRILLTLEKLSETSVKVLVEPNNPGTIVDYVFARVNGVEKTIGERSASSTENIGALTLDEVTLPDNFAVYIEWHTPSMGAAGAWTTNEFNVQKSQLYVEGASGAANPHLTLTNPSKSTVLLPKGETIAVAYTSNNDAAAAITSSEPTIASVNGNVVTAEATGTATITVSQTEVADTWKDASVEFEVNAFDWDDVAFIATSDYKFKASSNSVNLDNAIIPWHENNCIHLILPDAVDLGCSLAGYYETEGAGMFINVEAFTTRQTPFTVSCHGIVYDCYVYYNLDETAPVISDVTVSSCNHEKAVLAITANEAFVSAEVFNNSVSMGTFTPSAGAITVTGLEAATTYNQLTVKVKDAADNWSDAANVPEFTTSDAPTISPATYYGYSTQKGVYALYSITRNPDMSVTFSAKVDAAFNFNKRLHYYKGGVADVWVDLVYNSGTDFYDYTADAGLFIDGEEWVAEFYFPFTGDAASIVCNYTVGSEQAAPASILAGAVVLNKTSNSLSVGETDVLAATVYPSFATNKTIEWTSDNTAAATVDNGTVTAVADGTAHITAACGEVNAQYTVSVAASLEETKYYGTGAFTNFADSKDAFAYEYCFTRATNHEVTLDVVFSEEMTPYIGADNFRLFVGGNNNKMDYNAATKTATYHFGSQSEGTAISYYFYFIMAGGVHQSAQVSYTVGSANEKAYACVVSENSDNAAVLAAYDGRAAQVIVDRSFVAGSLYTLVLPFDADAAQTAEKLPGKLTELANTYVKDNGDLRINFVDVASVEAGVPYLYTPSADVVNPVFSGVTISPALQPTEPVDNIAKYYGIYAPATGASLKGTANAYVLGSDQYLYAASVLQDDQPMKALRGYFVLNFPSGANGAPRAKVIFNSHETETTTDVSNVQSDNIQCTKVIRDGQLLIIRDGRTYDAQGQLIK